MQVQISKWGNSLGLRIPKDIAAAIGLEEGVKVDITLENGHIAVAKAKRTYTIEELMADTTPEDYRKAMSPEDWAFWQTNVGREIIDE